MTQSEYIDQLAAALAKAQAVMGGALKDSTNPFFKSRYADLESVWTACRKALTDHGLAVSQTTEFLSDAGICVVTTLMHTSGQWLRGSLPIMAKETTPQGVGSAITYSRRYALAAICGVYQTDDDAETAMRHSPNSDESRKQDQKKVNEYVKRITDELNKNRGDSALSIWNEASQDHAFGEAVWRTLPRDVQITIKDLKAAA